MSDVIVRINPASLEVIARGPEVAALTRRVALEIGATMRAICPVSEPGEFHRSGRLRGSIHAHQVGAGHWRVGPDVDYGRWVNNGGRPHIIRSHGTWPLRDRETGQVFGPIVHHPGNRGRHFVEEAGLAYDGRQYRL